MNEQQNNESVPHLLRLLTAEITTLFSKEVSLARAELRESIGGIKTGLVALMSGGIVLLAGLIVLLMAAVYGLAYVARCEHCLGRVEPGNALDALAAHGERLFVL